MTPLYSSRSQYPARSYTVLTAVKPRVGSPLRFSPLTLDDVPRILPYLGCSTSRTCDFTVGGLLMWAGYFNYTYAIHNDTLYIKRCHRGRCHTSGLLAACRQGTTA